MAKYMTQAQREKLRERNRRFRELNPDYYKVYYQENKDYFQKKNRLRYIEHREEMMGYTYAFRKKRMKTLKPAQAWIGEARRAAGMTQKELAERCGVSLSLVRSWEYGYSVAREETIKEVLGIT